MTTAPATELERLLRHIDELGKLTRRIDLTVHPDARNLVAALVSVIRLAEASATAVRQNVPDLIAALRECITDEGARAMTDESRNAAAIARRRLDAISEIARAAIDRAATA